MVEEAVQKLVDYLFAQGGGYVLAIGVGLIAWVLDKRLREQIAINDKQADEVSKEVKEQYEKRLTEFRQLLDVMTNSTNTVTAMHNSLTASSDAINQLAAGFTKLMHEFTAQQARWDDRRGAMAKQLDDIQQRVEQLQRHMGKAA